MMDKKGETLFDRLSNLYISNLKPLFYGYQPQIKDIRIRVCPQAPYTEFWQNSENIIPLE